ncbi:MAG: ACP S-malonyltransferase [Candidatus Omnitrophota bacterium]|nr:ACP S-malonyltransferase [Candidatus Omnitrophota bacterium]
MVAYLFAGQGSQYIGMGRDLYESFPESKAVFDKANEVLGFDLRDFCFNGPQEMLKNTGISQPAILTVSIAALEAFKKRSKLKPIFMAGLSLGEYSALIASGALTFEQGVKLVRKRAQLMDDAAGRHPGKMAAVLGLDLEKIKEVCLKSGAEIANINAPGQIVISGKKEAVRKALHLCREAGAMSTIELEVSGAFHSSLMSEAAAALKVFLEKTEVFPPAVPVVSNYTAQPQDTPAEIRENLLYQIYSPVKWADSMDFILSQGVTKFFEFGPGKVLKGLMRRIDTSSEVVSIEKKEDILNIKGA